MDTLERSPATGPGRFSRAGRAARIAVAVLAVVVYVLDAPFGWREDTPLSSDQAAHYLGAARLAQGVADGDARLIRTVTLGPDLYPPGHSYLLGLWMLIAGQGVAAWVAFGLAVYVATALLLARFGLVAAALFLCSPLFGGLAPAVMVEPAAGLLLVAAVAAFPAGGTTRAVAWRAAAFGALTAALLLTKSNLGLPLVPAALVAAAATRDRRVLASVAIAIAVAVACWVAFLFAQVDGWANFRRFALNRANSAGLTPLGRLGRYFDLFATMLVPGRWVAVLTLALVAAGGWLAARPRGHAGDGRTRLVLCLAYVLVAMTALANHDYVLSRNLAGPALALFAAAGLVAATLPGRRRIAVPALCAVLVAGTFLGGGGASRRELRDRYYPRDVVPLETLDRAVAARLSATRKARVIGTFDQFNSTWVAILNRRRAPATAVAVDPPYPLARERSARSVAWSPVYADLVAGWAADGTERVLAIVVSPESRFHSLDYVRWCEWKQNLVRAVAESPAFSLTERLALPDGVELLVFDRSP